MRVSSTMSSYRTLTRMATRPLPKIPPSIGQSSEYSNRYVSCPRETGRKPTLGERLIKSIRHSHKGTKVSLNPIRQLRRAGVDLGIVRNGSIQVSETRGKITCLIQKPVMTVCITRPSSVKSRHAVNLSAIIKKLWDKPGLTTRALRQDENQYVLELDDGFTRLSLICALGVGVGVQQCDADAADANDGSEIDTTYQEIPSTQGYYIQPIAVDSYIEPKKTTETSTQLTKPSAQASILSTENPYDNNTEPYVCQDDLRSESVVGMPLSSPFPIRVAERTSHETDSHYQVPSSPLTSVMKPTSHEPHNDGHEQPVMQDELDGHTVGDQSLSADLPPNYPAPQWNPEIQLLLDPSKKVTKLSKVQGFFKNMALKFAWLLKWR